jgi:hypothetical protein
VSDYIERLPLERFSFFIQADCDNRNVLMLTDFISSFSVDELERLAKLGDAEATLKLADCHMYGLKNLARDEARARKLYEKAADLGSSEARTQCGQICYWQILQKCGLKDENASIPNHLSSEIWQINLKMWEYLEEAAKGGYVTLFMIKMDINAKSNTSWFASPNLNRTIEKRLIEIVDVMDMQQCAKSLISLYSRFRNKTYDDDRCKLVVDKNPPRLNYDLIKWPLCRYAYKCRDIYVHEQFKYADLMSEVMKRLNLQEEPTIPSGTIFMLYYSIFIRLE